MLRLFILTLFMSFSCKSYAGADGGTTQLTLKASSTITKTFLNNPPQK